jgi:hypothetical protein
MFDVIILIILYKWFIDSLSMTQYQFSTKSKLYWEFPIKFNILNNFQCLQRELMQLKIIREIWLCEKYHKER